MLELVNVSKSYESPQGAVRVLTDLNFSMAAGESVALTGESGSGKSTLLHLVAGLDNPDKGEVNVDGVDVAALSEHERARFRREKTGLVFQQFNLIPSLTVRDNIAFQARLAGRRDAAFDLRLAEKLGIAACLDRYPEQLSGGQQQRVAVARTLAARPPLVLADEPTGNLDEATGDAVLDLALELVAETGAAFLMVTHSRRLAGRLSRRVDLSSGALS